MRIRPIARRNHLRTRPLIDVENHQEVFARMLGLLADRGLLDGKRVGIGSTTVEASGAMCSIVRRDTWESYGEFPADLAKASDIDSADTRRLDAV